MRRFLSTLPTRIPLLAPLPILATCSSSSQSRWLPLPRTSSARAIPRAWRRNLAWRTLPRRDGKIWRYVYNFTYTYTYYIMLYNVIYIHIHRDIKLQFTLTPIKQLYGLRSWRVLKDQFSIIGFPVFPVDSGPDLWFWTSSVWFICPFPESGLATGGYMSVQYLFSLPVNRIPFVQSSIGVQLHTFQSPLSVNILIWTSNIRQFWHFFFWAILRFWSLSPLVSSICWWIQPGNRNSIKSYCMAGFNLEKNWDFPRFQTAQWVAAFCAQVWLIFSSFLAVQSPNFRNFLAIQLTPNSKQLAPRQSWERTEHSGPSRGMGSHFLRCSVSNVLVFEFPGPLVLWSLDPLVPWSPGALVPAILWWLWCLETILK